MPAVIPALAGFGAATWFAGSAFAATTLGLAAGSIGMIAASTVVGAVAGAVVGGLQSAITGGDIGEGLLYGAVGGAVGGALGGAFGADLFGTVGTSGGISGDAALQQAMGTPVTSIGEGGVWGNMFAPPTEVLATNSAGSIVSSVGANIGATAGSTAGGMGMSDMMTYGLLSGGTGLAQSAMTKSPYTASEEGVKEQLSSQEKINQNNIDAAKEAQDKNIAWAREQMQNNNSQFDQTLAQRNKELMTPYEQAERMRQIRMETASGVTLARKQQEAAATKALTPNEQEIQDYLTA